jgi:hypothetical protein
MASSKRRSSIKACAIPTNIAYCAEKLAPGDRDKRGLVWSTAFNEYRMTLQVYPGWEDASTKVAHLKKVKGVSNV